MLFSFSSLEADWQRFLVAVNTLVSRTGKPAPKVFISYAWEATLEATEPMQTRLALLQRDLLAAGAKEVFLDINHMDGDLVETMRRGMNEADVILMICTPRYYARVQDEKTNAAYEFKTALVKRLQNPQAIVPLWWSGTIETAVPDAVRDITPHDFRDSWARAQQLGEGETALLGRVFGLEIHSKNTLHEQWQMFFTQALGDKAILPSILTPLKTLYQQQSAGRPIVNTTDLPALSTFNLTEPTDAVEPSLALHHYLSDVITKAQGHAIKAGAHNTHTTVLWHGQALSHQRLLMSIQDLLWQGINQHQVIPLYIPLQSVGEVRGNIISHYLQQRCGYSEADVLSLKQHYRFVILLDNYDKLLQKGLRNALKEADTLSWPASTIVSSDESEVAQWRIVDNYLQRQGYDKATQLQVGELNPLQESRFVTAWQHWQPIEEAPLKPMADKAATATSTPIASITPTQAATLPEHLTTEDRIAMPNTLEAAWPFFLQAVKSHLQQANSTQGEPISLFISMTDNESSLVITRLKQLKSDLQQLGITHIWLDTPENQQRTVERNQALVQATHFLPICTPHYQQKNQDTTQPVANILQQVLQQQKSQHVQIMPVWFDGASFSSAVPKSLWSTLVRDMRDNWYYTHQLASLADPLGIIPALFNIKVGTDFAKAYNRLYASFQFALPNSLSSQSPALLSPLLRVWKEALSTDGMMRPRAGCYVWPDIRKGRESEERDPLQAYWENDILRRAKGEATENSQYSAPVYYLLGDSGSGKSTVLWEFSDTLWQQLHQDHIIPIRISLSNLTSSQDFLNEFLTKECGYSIAQIQLLKQTYRFLFLLDAYDELVVSQGARNLLQQSDLLGWKGAVVITARTSSEQDLHVMDQYLMAQQVGYANRRYLREFTETQITTYLQARAKYEQALTSEVIAKIETIPGLKELIANPLLLYLVTDILPELDDTQKHLTRYELYERFMQKWFGREFSRMIEEGKLSIPSQLSMKFEKALLTFAEEVAESMFVHRELVAKPDQLSEQAALVLSRVFQLQDNSEYLTPLRQASPLKPIGENFQFMHKSFFEHLMARILVALAALPEQERFSKAQQLLQHWPIQQEPQILYFLFDAWTSTRELRQILRPLFLAVVEASKKHPEHGQSAANAITILNWMNEQLINLDLSDTRLAGADLSKAILAHTQLQRANLQGAELHQSVLYKTSLQNADLRGLQMGEIPWWVAKGSSILIYHPHQPWVARFAEESIWILDINTGKPPEDLLWMQPLKGHTNSVTCIAFSADGQYLASGSKDTTIRLWDLKNGKMLEPSLIGHENLVIGVTFSQNDQRLVSVGLDPQNGHNTLAFWDIKIELNQNQPRIKYSSVGYNIKNKGTMNYTAEVGAFGLERINAGVAAFERAVFSPDGQYLLASGEEDRHVCFAFVGSIDEKIIKNRELPTYGFPGSSEYEYRAVYGLTFSFDNQQFAMGFDDKTIRVYDIKPLRVIHTLQGHTEAVCSVAFSRSGHLLGSGSYDKTVRIWDAKQGIALGQSFTGHTEAVCSIFFSKDSQRIVSLDKNGQVRLWDTKFGITLAKTVLGHTSPINSVDISVDGQYLASGGEDNQIYLWDPKYGKTLTQLRINWDQTSSQKLNIRFNDLTQIVNQVAFSRNGKFLAAAGSDADIHIFDVKTGLLVGQPLKVFRSFIGSKFCSITFSPDDKYLVSGSDSGCMRLWDPYRGIVVYETEIHETSVYSIAFSTDGRYLASGSEDKTVRIWNVNKKLKPLGKPLRGHTDSVNCVTWRDSKILVSASKDNTIRFWDVKRGVTMGQQLVGHTDSVSSITISPDGRYLVSGSKDKTACLWDIFNPDKPMVLAQILWNHPIASVSFLPVLSDDSTFVYQLALGDDNGMVSTWSIITQGDKPTFQLLWASKTEKMTMCISGTKLTSCQLDVSNRHLFELYGADVSEVEKTLGEDTFLATDNRNDNMIHKIERLTAPLPPLAASVTNIQASTEQEKKITNTNISYKQLMAVYEYLIKKCSQQKSGFEARLLHFTGLLVDILQPQVNTNLHIHLQTAETFKHHSFFKRDRYYDMLNTLIENKEGGLVDSTQVFVNYLKQCKEGPGADQDKIKVANAIVDFLQSKEIPTQNVSAQERRENRPPLDPPKKLQNDQFSADF